MKVKGGIWSKALSKDTIIYLCLTKGNHTNPFVVWLPNAKYGNRQRHYRKDWYEADIDRHHNQLVKSELTTW